MTDAPLVAIVTPVYNGMRYLAECLESVQRLDYPNLVHIVLDNASTDRTPEIIQAYQGRRVPLITRRNETLLPLVHNWNAAAKMIPASAKYFHLLCADDTMREDSISLRVAIAERDSTIGMVGCRYRSHSLVGEELPADQEVFDGQDLLRGYLRREHMALSGMFYLVRCTKLDPDRPYNDPTVVTSHDTEFNMRTAVGAKVGFVHDELVYWRLHEEQASSTYVSRGRYIFFDWFILLDRYGPYVMGHREYEACRLAYRRHYLRQMLLVKLKHRDKEVWDWHMQALRGRDDGASFWEFLDAMIDWAKLAIQGRRSAVGSPERKAFGPPIIYPKLT